MGRCNNRRVQAQAAERRNVPSRARFSKGPPKKNKSGRGSGGGGGGRGRGGGRGSATKQAVIDKIAQNVHRKKNTDPSTRGGISGVIDNVGKGRRKIDAVKEKDPFAGVDTSKFDEVVLSEESVKIVVELLTKLKVMEDNTCNATDADSDSSISLNKSNEQNSFDQKNQARSENSKLSNIDTLREEDFKASFNHIDEDEEDCSVDNGRRKPRQRQKPRSNDLDDAYALSAPSNVIAGGGYEEYNDDDFCVMDSTEWADQQLRMNGEDYSATEDENITESGKDESYNHSHLDSERKDLIDDDDDGDNDNEEEEKKIEPENGIKETPLFLHLTTELSFSEEDAARACIAIQNWDIAKVQDASKDTNVNTSASNEQTNKEASDTLESDELALAMDWLCLHLPEESLKKGFAPNSQASQRQQQTKMIKTKNESQIARTGNHRANLIPHPSISFVKPLSEKEWRIENDKAHRKLGFARLGFHHDESDQACEMTGPYRYNVAPEEDDTALRILLSLLESKVVLEQGSDGNGDGGHIKATAADLDYARMEREQEKEALEAIFAEDFEIVQQISSTKANYRYNENNSNDLSNTNSNSDEQHYKLKVKNIVISSLKSSSEYTTLENCILHVFTRPSYPTILPPLLLFSNPTLPPTLLRWINMDMVRKAKASMCGEPMIFFMMEYLSEMVPQLHQNFVKEQREKEIEAEQRRVRSEASCNLDIDIAVEKVIDAQYENGGKIGKRQRAKLRAAEKSYDRKERMELEAKEKEQRREERIAKAKEATSNVRFNMAEKYLEKREEERIKEEAERMARGAMNAAFLRGETREVARAEAKRARHKSLVENGIKFNEGDGDDAPKQNNSAEEISNNDKTDSLAERMASNAENSIEEEGNTNNIKEKKISGTTMMTLAFTERLKEFYKAAAKEKEARKQNGGEIEHGTPRLVKPTAQKDMAENIRDKDLSGQSSEEEEHFPTPVFVPCKALTEVMEDIESAQKQQPWLLSPEARAPSTDRDPSSIHTSLNLSDDQVKERSRINQMLKRELQKKHNYADDWKKYVQNGGEEKKYMKGKGSSLGERFSKMLSQRTRLPAFKLKDEIIETIAKNQVTVISGDTGCGKTTQVPQLVLDDLIFNMRGSEANIIVTQPRRISAIGVAERIASERCERVGETAGYSIRLENKRSSKTRLLLCTTGILLRRLQVDPDLASVSHVFVDEVHERDLDTDFLLIILKDLLVRRKSLKLVLMSATLNAGTFSEYFFGCPTVSIPGRAHPVKEYRLEDVLQFTGYEVEEGSDYALKSSDKNKPRYSKSALKKVYHPKFKTHVINSLSIVDESIINYELIAKLLEYITQNNDEGAILCFLPGFQEITKLVEELYKNTFFTDTSRVVIHPLHSSLSTAEQTSVFDVPPEGVRKIVISTNIAETSITIEDVVFVVDAGRVKENRQDEVAQMQTLVECWVSRASAKQRRGRAGRVRPGISYHMFSSHTHDNEMQDYQLPEMLRVGLEDLVLQVLLLDLGEPSIFLTKAVNPPTALAIKNSLLMLEGLGAVECEWGNDVVSDEKISDKGLESNTCEALQVGSGLTALGFHLATLPVDPRVGKMMIYGALFGCTDPALTIAAAMSARSPFMTPFDKRDAADEARREFATEGSDHLTTLTAFNKWKELRQNQGDRGVHSFLRNSFLSRLTLYQIEELRVQFADLLKDIGFLPSDFRSDSVGNQRHYSRNQRGRGQNLIKRQETVNEANSHSTNLQLVKAILCAGLYPNIIVAPRTLVGAAVKGDKTVGECAFNSRKGDVYLHPSTISFSQKKLESRYCCYHEIVKTSKIYVRDCTTVSEFALLLFGGNLKVHHARQIVTIDNWLNFRIAAKPATLVKHLRAQMESLLLKKIVSPEIDVTGSSEGKALIQAVSKLVEKEVKEIPDRSGAEIVKPWVNENISQGSRFGNRNRNDFSSRGSQRSRGERGSYSGRGFRGGRGRGRG